MAFLKNIWKTNSKHTKIFDFEDLSDEMKALQNAKNIQEAEDSNATISDNGVETFQLKYLGCTVVEKLVGENISSESVKNIIKVAKASRKKLPRVNMSVSLKGISVTDLQGNDLLNISICSISKCSTDATHRQVFSFVSTDANETMECHAFICSKRKMVETVTLAVAHAFGMAYEAWRILPSTKEFMKATIGTEKNDCNHEKVFHKEQSSNNEFVEKLIDFGDELIEEPSTCRDPITRAWVCFEDDFVTDNRNDFKTDLMAVY